LSKVFVLDKNKNPLMPCHPARARELLKGGKARILRRFPFTIILCEREGGDTQAVECKVDPGSKVTGLSLVIKGEKGYKILWAANLEHRGTKIKEALQSRRAIRRGRRHRHTRYRKARFDNRTRKSKWLPPSLESRIGNIEAHIKRLKKLVPIEHIAIETVRFDTQKLQNPEISGLEYQQGELFGYEVREYLLEKWQRECIYCKKSDIPLEVEHIVSKSKGGSNRVSNLTLACKKCNQKKANLPVEDFVQDKNLLAKIKAIAKAPLKDAAAVNSTRIAIRRRLERLGTSVAAWSGGRTKFNRIQQAYAKDHWIDAACVGESGAKVFIPPKMSVLLIKAMGRGSRQQCLVDKYGFPRTSAKGTKQAFGFHTGDLVKAIVEKGKQKGTHSGRVAIRTSGNFNIKTARCTVQGINYRFCRTVQRTDGYLYLNTMAASSSP